MIEFLEVIKEIRGLWSNIFKILKENNCYLKIGM